MGKKETVSGKSQPPIKVKPKLKATDDNQKSSRQDMKAQQYNDYKTKVDNTYVSKARQVPVFKPGQNSRFKVNPIKYKDVNFGSRIDNTYVYQPNRSLVGTGGLKLKLKSGPPEFKGYIIFINGFWGAPIENMGAVAWNSVMDKVPERGDPYSMRGAENTNEKNWEDSDDRYTPDEYKEDIGHPVKNTIKEVLYHSIVPPGRAVYNWLHATKIERYPKYWNVKQNNYKFTERYAAHFDAKDNIHYLNGSHGLESNPGHRMKHGRKQGLTWAKLNLHYMEKPTYDTFSPYVPGLSTPEYNPITIVMHSQGNAFGVGVAKGIIDYLKLLKWDKVAINMVYLALHQNMGYKGDEYKNYKTMKLDMLANRPMKASMGEFFERDKIKLPRGIDDYAKDGDGGSSWNKLKTRGVQFTFSNDRADVVSRMGDIHGIANACNSDGDDVHPTAFELVGGSYKIYSKHIMNKLLKSNGVDKNGEVKIDPDQTVLYTNLVANYAKVYYACKKLKADIQSGKKERYSPYIVSYNSYNSVSATRDYLGEAESLVVEAYTALFDAELKAHSGPTAWGLSHELLEWSNGKSVFELIKEKGSGIFYRKTNKKPNLLLNPLTIS
ncbi:hypothetical protein [Pedobacter cryoconitis]|uniref:Uncharacterized protein n=1 Tax=Pedobacter cryoconitis TaxID=188932 RepID=A0A327T6C0_9SPHI|nr:hypothetical protein [Pedobacter cryoconitis]RAJ37156.1 hypothetical protein LY11_00231 [Pedobacter cryoconitis]